MALEGDLAVIGIADIFQTLAASQKAGTLIVENPESRKSIYFQEGMVWVISEGVRKTIKLGESMIAQNKITPAQLANALEQQQTTRERLGEILQSMGLVTEGDVEGVIRSQLEEDIFDVFTWKTGKFKFLEDTIPEGFDQTEDIMNLNVQSIVMEAARRSDELEVVREYIPSDDYVFKTIPGADQDKFDDTFAELVLGMLDGKNTVNDVANQLGGHRFELKSTLADLIQENIIEPIATESMVELGIAAMDQGNAERAARLLQVAVAQDPEDVGNFLLLSEAYESSGDKKRAGHTYKRGATAAAEAGEVEHAVDFLARARRLLPNDLEVNEQVLELLTAFADHIPDSDARFADEGKALVKAYRREKRYPDAIRLCHRLLQEDPEEIEVHKHLVNIYLDQENNVEALAEYDVLAQLLTKRKDWDELQGVLEKIAKLDPSRTNEVNKRLDQIVVSGAERKSRSRRRMAKTLLGASIVILLIGAGGTYQSANVEWGAFADNLTVEEMAKGKWENSLALIDDWCRTHAIKAPFVRSRIAKLRTEITLKQGESQRDESIADGNIRGCIDIADQGEEAERRYDFGLALKLKKQARDCLTELIKPFPTLQERQKDRLEIWEQEISRLKEVLDIVDGAALKFREQTKEVLALAKAQKQAEARDVLDTAFVELRSVAAVPLLEAAKDSDPDWAPGVVGDLADFRAISFPVLIASASGKSRPFEWALRDLAVEDPLAPIKLEWKSEATPMLLDIPKDGDVLVRFTSRDFRMVPVGSDVKANGTSYGRSALLRPDFDPEYLIETRYYPDLRVTGLILQCAGLDLSDKGGSKNELASIYGSADPFLVFEEYRFGKLIEGAKETCTAAPVELGGTLLIPANDHVYQLDATGKLIADADLRIRELGLPSVNLPIVAPPGGGSVYAVTVAGAVVELDPANGLARKGVWVPEKSGLRCADAISFSNGTIVYNTGSAEVMAFDTRTKQFSSWSVTTDSPTRRTSGGLIIEGGKLYVPTDLNLLVQPFGGGALVPRAKAQPHTEYTGALAGHLVAGNGCLYGVDRKGPTLMAFGNGGELTRNEIGTMPTKPPANLASPAVSPELIVVCTADSQIMSFRPWRAGQQDKLEPRPWAPIAVTIGSLEADPVIAGKELFIANTNGDVTVYDTDTGVVIWRFSSFADALVPSGKLTQPVGLLAKHVVVAVGNTMYLVPRD